LITISRNLARQLRTVFRRCGIKPSGHSNQRVHFSTAADGVRIRATELDVAVEYHVPAEMTPEEFSLPLEFLDRCEAKRDDPVTLETQPRNLVLASWNDDGVPQQVHYDAKPATKSPPFPAVPEQFADVGPSLWSALARAKETVDHEGSRYALACIQLRGSKGQIVTTDGRQVLFQGGFQFPWTEDLLIHAPTVLGWSELAQNNSIGIGRTEDHVALRLGPWTILLWINKDGRFPRVDDVLPPVDSIKSRLLLNDTDAEFLLRILPRLPSVDDDHQPVTLDLNGQVAVRSKPLDGRPTEVGLSGSKLSGEPISISTNRQYLLRAVKLGFREIGISSTAAPLVCRDEHRQYGWMSLGDGDAIQAMMRSGLHRPLQAWRQFPPPKPQRGVDRKCPRNQPRRAPRLRPTKPPAAKLNWPAEQLRRRLSPAPESVWLRE
jgi:hypothetical protein